MTTHAINLKPEEFSAVFGPQSDISRETGRSRLCNTCGSWHRLDKPLPHNCRKEAPPRSSLSSPMVTPPFQPFKTGRLDTAEIITNRYEKREFMEKNDLAEWDAGVASEPEPTERAEKRAFAEDFKRALQIDPLSQPPVERVGESDMDGAGDISVDDIEVFK